MKTSIMSSSRVAGTLRRWWRPAVLLLLSAVAAPASAGQVDHPASAAQETPYVLGPRQDPVLVPQEDPGPPQEYGPVGNGLSAHCPENCAEDNAVFGPCFDCRGGGLFWVRPEYLLWWMDGFAIPPLVTSSRAGTDRRIAGVLGEPDTVALVGPGDIAGGARSGGRISLGTWFDSCHRWGIEVVYLGLGTHVSRSRFDSLGDPILARPFYNVEPGEEGQDAELVAYPGLLEGNIQVTATTSLQGVELLWREALLEECWRRIDWTGGWRFLRLDEELLIHDFKTSLDGSTGLAPGTTMEEFDLFRTRNSFHGAELGVDVQVQRCRWNLGVSMKLAMGTTSSRAVIDGQTTVDVPVPTGHDVTVRQSGLLVQQTNIGERHARQFAMIPELGIKLAYQFSPRLRASLGYTFLYWSRVARPGDQVDFGLNLSQLETTGLVGTPRPEFEWKWGDFWAQGIDFGLEYRF